MNYAVGEFSALTGLGVHTLRYYEKEELIHPERLQNGRRLYAEKDVAWIQFVVRLKDTGMPIREIRKYAALRAAGNTTLAERTQMLIAHRSALSNEILELQNHLQKLDLKIDWYRAEMEKNA